MFVFEENPIFEWKIEFKYPVGGQIWRDEAFTAIFMLLPDAEMRLNTPDPTRQEIEAHDRAMMQKALVGWRDLSADGATDLPFTDENRDKLLGHIILYRAILKGYVDAVFSSGEGVKSKN